MKALGITKKSAVWMGLVFALVIVLDQITKLAIVRNFERGDIHSVIPDVFNLTLAFNRGAAFGMFSGVPDGTRQIILGVTTLIALSAVLFFLMRDFHGDRIAQLCLAMILGGAVGNIIDRVRLGEVIDFLDVYWGSYHWPAFNVADSAICVGVVLLILRRPRCIESKEAASVEQR